MKLRDLLWSQKSEQKAITANLSQVQRDPASRSRSWDSRLADVDIH
jgi:hypothetical protein